MYSSASLTAALLSSGGTLQHARGLLCLAGGSFLNVNSVSCNSSSSSAPALSEEHGRSISTTRGIYMGRCVDLCLQGRQSRNVVMCVRQAAWWGFSPVLIKLRDAKEGSLPPERGLNVWN